MVLVLHVIEDFKNGVESDIFDRIWTRLLKIYDNREESNGHWQSLDSISIKSPLGGAKQAIILLTEAN